MEILAVIIILGLWIMAFMAVLLLVQSIMIGSPKFTYLWASVLLTMAFFALTWDNLTLPRNPSAKEEACLQKSGQNTKYVEGVGEVSTFTIIDCPE